MKLPIGWSQVQGDALKALGLDASALHDKATGLDASIYTDGHGHYVIAYAGSAGSKIPTMSRDWDQDYESIASPVFANASGQTEAAANLARTVVAQCGGGTRAAHWSFAGWPGGCRRGQRSQWSARSDVQRLRCDR